jgi:hypothetical protein
MSNRSYSVLCCDLLGGFWAQLTNVPSLPSNSTQTIFDTASTSNRYYRLVTPSQP